ncbi:hypothetical protein KV557_11645 [Kitasatospora aureofaciens]|uniref:hypothetical protein n=1 Tax=Kitasatospora aureofaciens TaxID=1894 RepID=UPI001C4727A2|nr:hypothetical protein [Kitasatospora aureofaciens]MBV6697777.1 hypothetical protein [Kitasatospora aureofaciens]
MTRTLTLPLIIPASLVDAHRLDLTADGWGFATHHAVATASGDTYAMSTVRRYSWAPGATDPAERNFDHRVITRYAPDGTPTATALFGHPRPDGTPWAIVDGDKDNLAVLPDGTIAISSTPGSTHLISPDLSQVLASWRMPWGWEEQKARTGDPFAASIAVTPSGRLLCMTSEYGLSNWSGARPNIVAVSEPGSGLAPGAKAPLRALATLDARTARQTEADRYPHVLFRGAPVWRDNRPSPSLTELLSELTGTSGSLCRYEDSTMTRPAALRDDLFVVPVFGKLYRSTNLGQEFSFALLDDQGVVRGRLEGLDRRKDSPFTGFDFTVVADPHRGRAFHLNRYGLYAWTAEGQLRSRLSTEDKPFKPLKHFALLECTPAGELLLCHRKQHLLLRVPVPDDLGTLPAAVEAALKGYGPGRNALKKQYAPVDWHWVDNSAEVHHL